MDDAAPVAAGADHVVAPVAVDVGDRHGVEARDRRQRLRELLEACRAPREGVDRVDHAFVQAVHVLAGEHVAVAVIVEVADRDRLEARRLTGHGALADVVPVEREPRHEAEDPELAPGHPGEDLVGRHAGDAAVDVAHGQRPAGRRGIADQGLSIQVIADAEVAPGAPGRVLDHEQGGRVSVRAPHEREEVDRRGALVRREVQPARQRAAQRARAVARQAHDEGRAGDVGVELAVLHEEARRTGHVGELDFDREPGALRSGAVLLQRAERPVAAG